MAALISLDKIHLAFGMDPLLDDVQLQINTGERVCLIGRNGAGKSSLLKIIDGTLVPDAGQVYRDSHIKIARLTQELPQDLNITVYDFVAQGLEDMGALLRQYHHLLSHLTQDPADLQRLEVLQKRIDDCNGWLMDQSIQEILQRLDLPADKCIAELSGGWQRRVALAKALVMKPDLLLLDEPTNHLDITAIQWLEEQLLNYQGGILFITHDRALLQRLATRIVELDRGKLYSWPGDYANFLRRKEEAMAAEETQNKLFDKKLAEEEKWIRQGIKARRTRNEGRVRALEAMRRERQQRRDVQGKAKFEFNEAQRSGNLVIEAEHVTKHFNDKIIIRDFSTRIMRGDRIGLLGPNGAGKSTLLNILLGKLKPDSGEVIQGTQLQVAYFDQLRNKLDPEKNIIDNVAEGRTSITVNGQDRHIVSYLNDFLFSPQRMRTPVKALSGGECNRLLLARLFSLPANVLVMDEPTNDLDIETLELLEELLSGFAGTLLLVSHDRAFLDNIVTSTLVFKGDGVIEEYIGGYVGWHQNEQKFFSAEKKSTQTIGKQKTEKIKLSYKEQRELENLPDAIEVLEQKQKMLLSEIEQPAFYQQDAAAINRALDELKQIEKNIQAAYQRWDELTNRF